MSEGGSIQRIAKWPGAFLTPGFDSRSIYDIQSNLSKIIKTVNIYLPKSIKLFSRRILQKNSWIILIILT